MEYKVGLLPGGVGLDVRASVLSRKISKEKAKVV